MSAAAWSDPLLASHCDSVNVLVLGTFDAATGASLLRAFADYLHYACTPSRLVLATPGADALAAEVARLAVADAVDFLPAHDAATRQRLYRIANLLVLPAGAAADALAGEATDLGLPVVRVQEGAALPASTGLCLAATPPEELAPLLHALLSERGLRRALLADQQAQCGRSLADGERLWKVEGPFDSSYSLAIVNRELAQALAQRGRTLAIDITPGSQEAEPDAAFLAQDATLRAMHARARSGTPVDVVLRNTYPPSTLAMQGRIRVMQSYGWEETGFPDRYVRWFNNNLDLVTVVSSLVGKVLRDAGIRLPIAVVGNGADHPHAAEAGEAPLPDLGKSYRFLHISSCFPRKGVDVLLAAWGQAFRASDPVTLVIKTFPNPHNDVAAQLSARRAADPAYPDVVLIEADWPDARIAALYRACQAFVAPSRGEGFGLPCIEAMRFGLPLIVTGWGGQRDFVSPDNAWLIDYRFAPARTHIDAGHSAWAEPDVAHLARLLREVYLAPHSLLTAKTARARQVAATYDWARVAARTEDAIARLAALPQIAVEPALAWVSTWNSRCGIAAYSAYLSSALPPYRLRIFASQTPDTVAPDPAHVTRCWQPGQVDGLLAALRQSPCAAWVIQYHPAFFTPIQLAMILEAGEKAGRQTHVFLHATRTFMQPDIRWQLVKQLPILARATRIYVHGIDDLNTLKDFGLVDNVTLFPHGVPARPAGDRLALRQKHGLEGKKIIGTYGFLLPHKGVRQQVEALARLLPRHPDLHLLICCAHYPSDTSHAESAALDALIAARKLEAHVTRVHDYLPEAESLAWLQMADLLLFAYQNTEESSSAAVRMALASGRPVATTPLTIFDDLDETVMRLPGTSVDALVTGLENWLRDPEACTAGPQAAAARYCQSRAWPNLSQRLLNLIDGLAQPF
jgi:glycosyltransferase involved in cell wall biosynthesis